MKKLILVLGAIMLAVSELLAGPVSQTTARKVGVGFAQNRLSAMKTDQIDLVKTTDAYYVFNIGQTGFVIVSADDSFRPIIGYSDEGAFPTENPSPEMMYYLNDLSMGRKAALRSSIEADEQVKAEWNALMNQGTMAPRNGNRSSFYLLKTKWNQDFPYNKFCPTGPGGRCYAGCVATAMSQVMNYWQHPTHGYGSHSFVDYTYGELSADFSTAEYRFDLMPNSIDNMSPVENIDAIALFMYHCGISVNMMYSPDGSGAYSQDVPEAVLKYFGYTNRCRLHSRNNYSLEEFQAMLKDQFDMGWPCYYSGQDTGDGGGHAFVCDGYDENDMFHFNWGWSGSGDGFFVIDGLNVSSYAFNGDQAFIANFVPDEVFLNTVKAPDYFTAVPNGDDEFSVTLSWTNPSATLDGHAIESLDEVVVMRDGVTVHTFDHPEPGETMNFIDPAGMPVMVNYTVHAVYHGYTGRKAHSGGLNLGPTCQWTARLSSEGNGWGEGMVTLSNASGMAVAVLSTDRGEQEISFEVPQGRIAMQWTAPADSLQIGLEILDSEGQTVFSYNGPSTLMPQGLFYEMVNTCGGNGSIAHPTELKAEMNGDDVVLHWTGVDDPGYGYSIYRDGYFYAMVSETSYTDLAAATGYHAYFVTVFSKEGESEPSNTVCAVSETDDRPALNFDYQLLEEMKVKLTWEKPSNEYDLAGFSIYRKAQDSDYKRIKLCNGNVTTYTDPFVVDDGHRYYYKIVAVYRPGNVESAPARSLRNPDLTYLEVNRTHIPSGLTIEPQNDALLLHWDAALLAETYNVYCNGEKIASDLTEPTFTDILRGDALMYQVTGVLNGVESSPSNSATYGNYAVDDPTVTEITFFPNPANGYVTVKADDLNEIAVYNVAGQQVLRRKVEGNEVKLDLAHLRSGVYFLQVHTRQGCSLQKVVLMN